MSSLFDRMRDFIIGKQPPTLRNRPGGMAMIHGLANVDSGKLNGRIVTTVSAGPDGYWVIEPPQPFVVQLRWKTIRGEMAEPGDRVEMVELADEHLRPLKNPGSGEKSQELSWSPPVPTGRKVPS